MNDYDLKERVAIITGGAQGIGLAVANRMLASGARLAIWDRDRALLEETVTRIAKPDRVHSWVIDIADLAAVEAATKATFDHFGKIDILINNAAIVGPNAPTWEYPPEAFRDVVNIGLICTFYCCRAVVPHMIAANYGRIVNLASIAGKEGNPRAPAYSSMKAGVIALTKSLGKELATYISVNLRDAGRRQDGHGHESGSGFPGHGGFQDPTRPHARAGRGVVHDFMARDCGKLLHHGRRLRSFRRPGDLLTVGEARA
jgi:3-oxoacyl-[acyl-carrier protein] reductase